ncbi:hypothetical protein IC582_025826 [Cucumis melo]
MVHQSRQTQVATPRDGPSSRLRISIRMSRLSLIRNFRFFSFCSGIGRPETHTRGARVELLDNEKRVNNPIIVP